MNYKPTIMMALGDNLSLLGVAYMSGVSIKVVPHEASVILASVSLASLRPRLTSPLYKQTINQLTCIRYYNG